MGLDVWVADGVEDCVGLFVGEGEGVGVDDGDGVIADGNGGLHLEHGVNP